MSHLDDGLLHTYLDEELAAGEVARLREHVASCADCRARLDLARETRTRAHEILRFADPPGIVTPDFATLAARRPAPAAASAAPVTRYRPLLLPWAASVLLAIAVGWSAQELIRGSGGGGEMVAVQSESDSDAAAATSTGRARPLASGAEAATMAEEAVDDVAPPPAAPQRAMGAVGTAAGGDAGDVAGRSGRGGGVGGADAAAGGAAPAAPAVRQEALAISQNEAAAGRAAVTSGAAAAEVQAQVRDAPVAVGAADRPQPFAAAPPPPAPSAGPQAWPESWTSTTREVAATILGQEPLTVTGVSVERYEVGGGERPAVRVLQRLPGGEALEVLQRRTLGRATDMAANQAIPPVRREAEKSAITLARAGIEIEIRAAVSADSMRRLQGEL